jgi:peptidoglycan-N-acetylglucosamine deacetylase
VLRRRREYYVGERPRRRAGRAAVIAAAVLAAGGVATLGVYLPAIGGAPASAGPIATEATGALPPSIPPSAIPTPRPTSPAASAFPMSEPPPPCEPPTTIEPAVVRSHGDFHTKTVALTFDDGTNPENTRQILRILKKHHVNATFFPTGRSMERFPDVWRAIARAGYPIANHTYKHVALAGKCYEPQRRELARANEVFVTLGIPELPAMRPPYELWDDTTSVAAAAEGLQAVVLWNVDTEDWRGASAATIRRVALQGGRGSIILLHTFPEATAAALPAIIRGFKARGFTFVTIGQLLGIDGSVPYPEKGEPQTP